MHKAVNELLRNQAQCDLGEKRPSEQRLLSRLFPLEPIGTGTPLVESLASYVTRLAEAHCVYPRVLMLDEVIPLLRQPRWQGNETNISSVLSLYFRVSSRVNGTTNTAGDLVQAIEQLTRRSDLRFLTLLTWRSILPVNRLLRGERAWCPACYEDWRESNHSIYDMLLWSLVVNQVCPHHRLQLQTRCPAPLCGRSMPPFTQRMRPGYCAYCQAWLGGSWQYQTQKFAVPEDQALHHQQWIGTELGDWLATAPNLSAPSREQITSTIAFCVERFTQGNKVAFSRYIHVDTARVPLWLNASRVPELESLLQLCFHTGISLVNFLAGKITAPATSDPKVKEAQPSVKQSRSGKRIDIKKLKEALEAALQDAEVKPTSLHQLTISLSCALSTIKAHFPELALALKNRYREVIHRRKLQREEGKLERDSKRKERELAHNTVRTNLEAALQTTESVPLPLEKIAQQLGYPIKYLKKNFPDQCQALVSRYKEFVRERVRRGEQQMRKEIEEVMLELHKQGQDPKAWEIGELLKRPGVLRNPKARAIIAETKRAIASTL